MHVQLHLLQCLFSQQIIYSREEACSSCIQVRNRTCNSIEIFLLYYVSIFTLSSRKQFKLDEAKLSPISGKTPDFDLAIEKFDQRNKLVDGVNIEKFLGIDNQKETEQNAAHNEIKKTPVSTTPSPKEKNNIDQVDVKPTDTAQKESVAISSTITNNQTGGTDASIKPAASDSTTWGTNENTEVGKESDVQNVPDFPVGSAFRAARQNQNNPDTMTQVIVSTEASASAVKKYDVPPQQQEQFKVVDYRKKLVSFYTQYEPSKLAIVEAALEKYKGVVRSIHILLAFFALGC